MSNSPSLKVVDNKLVGINYASNIFLYSGESVQSFLDKLYRMVVSGIGNGSSSGGTSSTDNCSIVTDSILYEIWGITAGGDGSGGTGGGGVSPELVGFEEITDDEVSGIWGTTLGGGGVQPPLELEEITGDDVANLWGETLGDETGSDGDSSGGGSVAKDFVEINDDEVLNLWGTTITEPIPDGAIVTPTVTVLEEISDDEVDTLWASNL